MKARLKSTPVRAGPISFPEFESQKFENLFSWMYQVNAVLCREMVSVNT
jgi:hypothetical protein